MMNPNRVNSIGEISDGGIRSCLERGLDDVEAVRVRGKWADHIDDRGEKKAVSHYRQRGNPTKGPPRCRDRDHEQKAGRPAQRSHPPWRQEEH